MVIPAISLINEEGDEKKESWGEFLRFLNNKEVVVVDAHSKASIVFVQDSLKNNTTTVIDFKKNKGVCTQSCFLIPLLSDKLNTSCSITGKAEPSTRFCEICNEPKPAKGMQQAGGGMCDHYFCIDCAKEYLMKKVNESGLPVECPEKECKTILPDYFNKFIPQEMLDRYYASQRMAKALASSSSSRYRYVVCPSNDCRLRFLDDMKLMFRHCPKCWKLICMKKV